MGKFELLVGQEGVEAVCSSSGSRGVVIVSPSVASTSSSLGGDEGGVWNSSGENKRICMYASS